jgi:hypothetical protein
MQTTPSQSTRVVPTLDFFYPQGVDDYEVLWRRRLSCYHDSSQMSLIRLKRWGSALNFIYAGVTVAAVGLCGVYLHGGWWLLSQIIMAALLLGVFAHQHRHIDTKHRCKEQLRQTKWLLKHLHDAILCKRRYYTKLDQEVVGVLSGRKAL